MNIILFENIPKYISHTDDRAIHIRKILKLKEGDSFRAGILDGPTGEVRITAADEKGYTMEWLELEPPADLYPLTLLTGFVRPISAKRILREAASLGVKRLVFSVTDTGERSYLSASLWKSGEYREYLKNGLQTAGATVIPRVELHGGVHEAVSASLEAAENPVCLLLDNITGKVPISEKQLHHRQVVLAVGSERGWSDRERSIFLRSGFEPVKLGSRILRTETACSVGTALALEGMGFI